jgi:hypothetical protein
MKSLIDPTGSKITIAPDTSIVRIDGIILCKRIVRDGKVILQFKDGDRIRSRCRNTPFVEIPLDAFAEALKKS